MDLDTDALTQATANMNSKETEAYIKAQLSGEIKPEPTEPKEEEPQKKPEVTVEEEESVTQPKDKAKQKEKILKSQARMWKEKAEKAEAEHAELLRKVNAGEIENSIETNSDIIDRMIEAKLAKANISQSIDMEKSDFIKSHPTEIDLLSQYEEVVKENPTLSIEQARLLYLAENKPEQVYDPTVENRKRLAKQATPAISVSTEEKKMEDLSSDEIAKLGKEWASSGKINKNF